MVAFLKLQHAVDLLCETLEDSTDQRAVLTVLFGAGVNSSVALIAGTDTGEIAEAIAALVEKGPPAPLAVSSAPRNRVGKWQTRRKWAALRLLESGQGSGERAVRNAVRRPAHSRIRDRTQKA